MEVATPLGKPQKNANKFFQSRLCPFMAIISISKQKLMRFKKNLFYFSTLSVSCENNDFLERLNYRDLPNTTDVLLSVDFRIDEDRLG